jgi:hypothetical protein
VALDLFTVLGTTLAILAGFLTLLIDYLRQRKRRAEAPTLEDRVKTLARDWLLQPASPKLKEKYLSGVKWLKI